MVTALKIVEFQIESKTEILVAVAKNKRKFQI